MKMANGQNAGDSGKQSGEAHGTGGGRGSCVELHAQGERAGRIAALQASVQAGTYRLSSTDLAECLMRRMLQPR